VAPDLLGRLLVRRLPEGLVVARIVECEAYQEDDPASHSYRGLTNRTAVMFGPPGRLYVYFSYGMHFCMNVVTGDHGEGSAVLLRAAEPVEGLEAMAARRGLASPRLLCSGPGRLTQAFGVTRANDGLDLTTGVDLFLAPGKPIDEQDMGVSPRVGISVAREQPWRFFELRTPFVSRRGRPSAGRRRSPAGVHPEHDR
jgi:DNA-3-methyladenine glycosylase